jgi:hypothetical protein
MALSGLAEVVCHLSAFGGTFVKITDLVTSTTPSAALSAIGVLLVIAAIVLAVTAPKWVVISVLLAGMACSIAGFSWALFHFTENVIPRVSKDKALANLEENSRVSWLIRLVTVSQPNLGINSLTNVGPPEQKFAFVAPYDEVRGVSVKEAVYRVGGTYVEGPLHASGIIFPLPPNEILYPANARGLLQVIMSIEADLKDGPFLTKEPGNLDGDDIKDLENKNIWSWRFENYRDKFQKYCKLTHRFRCNPYPAKKYIGGINFDWHPLGISQSVREEPCRPQAPDLCASADWKILKQSVLRNFGSRVFFLRNLELSKLDGRMMIDFNNPSTQVIPDIGVRAIQE